MVRVGIGIYGIAPAPALAGRVELVPALSVKARVSHVQTLPAGARLSYGLRYETAARRRGSRPCRSATPTACRASSRSDGGEVLIGGRRHPIAGTVTMDQLMVDVGDAPVDVGDEVVLIGTQGDERITAEEWAERMDTIAYTIVCGVGPRVPAGTREAELSMSLVKRIGIARGRARRRRGRRVRRAAARGARGCAARPTATRRVPSTRPCTSTTGSTPTTAARSTSSSTGNELDPPIVLSHGVTLSVRTWFHQLEELPKEGFRTIAFDHRGHGQSVLGEEGHSLDNLGRDVKTVLEGLDLHDAVLVGHSMGGVAVQSFVTQFPEIAAERVAGIVLLSTLAYTPLGSRSTRTKARLEKLMKRAPDAQWLWDSPNLGFLAARRRLRQEPAPEPRRARPHDDERMPAGDPARRAARARRARPHPRAPEGAHPDARDRRHRRRADAAVRGARMARLIPGARLELLQRRRPHAHARTDRRARPAHRRLRHARCSATRPA